jgi:hypothetical protein
MKLIHTGQGRNGIQNLKKNFFFKGWKKIVSTYFFSTINSKFSNKKADTRKWKYRCQQNFSKITFFKLSSKLVSTKKKYKNLQRFRKILWCPNTCCRSLPCEHCHFICFIWTIIIIRCSDMHPNITTTNTNAMECDILPIKPISSTWRNFGSHLCMECINFCLHMFIPVWHNCSVWNKFPK